MKNNRTFAVTSIRNGRYGSLQDVAGIFYVPTLRVRYGSVTPCGALMRPLPFHRWKSKGSAEPFFISAPQIFLTGMTSPGEKRLPRRGVSAPVNRPTHETGPSSVSPSAEKVHALLEQLLLQFPATTCINLLFTAIEAHIHRTHLLFGQDGKWGEALDGDLVGDIAALSAIGRTLCEALTLVENEIQTTKEKEA